MQQQLLPVKEFVNIILEITEKVDGLSQSGHESMVVLLHVLLLNLLQVWEPGALSVLAGLAPLAAVGQVVGVGHRDLLRLVPDQPDPPPHLRGHAPLEAALA